ncbi:MAG: DUF1844 domain-containing protein [Planctomycetes bacterium]|nr:DUF1844 domain-containing protein [Planctomycetota bacterium]
MSEEKHIDEDWKMRARAEKEKFAQSSASKEPPGEEAEGPEGPSFIHFISTLATQALMALGQVPHPATGQKEMNLPEAKYLIDTIQILEAKTKGNLTPEEAQAMKEVLYNLQMAFVAISKKAKP